MLLRDRPRRRTREKQGAATIAAVLDLPAAARTVDFTDSLRAGDVGDAAPALDAIAAGAPRRVLIAPADCRHGRAGLARPSRATATRARRSCSAAPSTGIAEVVAHAHGERRVPRHLADRRAGLPARASRRLRGQARLRARARRRRCRACSSKAGVAAERRSPRRSILPTPQSAGAASASRRRWGSTRRRQLQDGLWTIVGDTRRRRSRCVLLAAALERAQAGRSDAGGRLRRRRGRARCSAPPATPPYRAARASRADRGEAARSRRTARYARFRRLDARRTRAATTLSSPVITLPRSRRAAAARTAAAARAAARCSSRGTGVCIECGHGGGLERRASSARRGTLFTFTDDHVHESPDRAGGARRRRSRRRRPHLPAAHRLRRRRASRSTCRSS